MRKYIYSFLFFLCSISWAQTDFSSNWEDFYSYNNVDANIRIEQKLHRNNFSLDCSSGCSRPDDMKSSENSSRERNNASNDSSMGSIKTPVPWRLILTSLPGILNSFGRRTAWDCPFMI